MANLEIAKSVAKSKVHTIVVPFDFKGIVNAKISPAKSLDA